jgi:hypothetical protein
MGAKNALRTCIICLALALGGAMQARAQYTIGWNSALNKTNLTSTGTPMDGAFRFELGVFKDGFTPTQANKDLWAANWHPVDSTYYLEDTKRYAGNFTVQGDETYDDGSLITVGTSVYVWGFRGTPQNAEWILFRNSDWIWPTVNLQNPPANTTWPAEQADTPLIIGEISASGMESEAVTNARPPDTPWADWQTVALAGEPLNEPNNDPDNDGASNLLEFVMGSNPKASGGVPATPVTIVPVSSNKHLQITIPRRIDRPAILTVQVANHPAGPWDSGDSYTTVVSSDIHDLIVRDNTPISSSHPHRFMRLKVELPPESPPEEE